MQLEQWVTQKYNELVENPDSVRRLVHMHNSGTLPPDAGPHIAVLKKLLSDQQKASGIQAKYTALILACQKEALAHGDRKRAQLAIRGLQQKQEEERRRASAEQQKYIRQEAAKMATEVVEKEARAARGTQNKDSFPGVFSASLFQGGGDPSGDFLGAGLPSPGQLPSPESFFASGAFGSVEKLPGGHSALRGEAARTESPDMFGNGGMPKSVQMYPRSVSPVPLVPVQQSSASGGLQWDSRFNDNQLEPFPIGTDRTEPAPAGDRQHFSEASQEGRLQGREDDRSGLQGDRSVKRRKEELRAVGGSGEEGLKVKRLSELRDISREGSPVIAQLGRKPLRPAGSLPPMGKSAPGASADQDSAARESHVAASQPENVPVKRPKSMDSSGSDSEDEPLILTASKRALGVGSEPRLVRDPSTEKKGGLAGEKAKRSLGGMLSESLVGEEEVRVSDEAAGVGATEATTSKLEKVSG